MTMAAIKEYAEFFRQFLDLCLKGGWPDENTPLEHIAKAFEVAQHVETSVIKMKTKSNCFDKFMELLHTNQNFSHVVLQRCMSDPPKSILKKILTSDAPVNLIDVAFERFQCLYSEDRLVETLSQLMVEAASKETLLRNMSIVLPAHKLQVITNQLYLFLLLECESPDTCVDMLKDCCQEMIDISVLCLVKDTIGLKDEDFELVRKKIITGFTNIMDCKDISTKKFWKSLFNIDQENLVALFLKYKALREMTFEALGDCYNLIVNLQLEPYIQLTESQYNMILENELLRSEFTNYMKNNGYDAKCMPVFSS